MSDDTSDGHFSIGNYLKKKEQIDSLTRRSSRNNSKNSATKSHYKGTNYEKIIRLCIKAGVDVSNGTNKKFKEYPLLIEACHKKKRELIKSFTNNISKYASKSGYGDGDFTSRIARSNEIFIKKLKLYDKLINNIEKELRESDKKYNIYNFMNIPSDNDKPRIEYTNVSGDYIDEYSDK